MQILNTDDLVRMSFPLLASLGVRLDKENLYTNLLAAVKEKKLGRDVPRADDDVVVDDRLMMACNIYIFQFFSKKLF